jgi:phosphoglycerol transferase MdoB-like AlkP superfamily enzyme
MEYNDLKNGYSSNVESNKYNIILKYSISLVFFIIMYMKCIIFMNAINSANATDFSLKSANMVYPILFAAFIFIFISISYLFRGKGYLIYLNILNMLYSAILVGDLWYYRGFVSFLSPHLFSQTGNLNDLSSSVASMARRVDITIVADIIPLIIVSIILMIVLKSGVKQFRFKKRVFAVTMVLPLGVIGSSYYFYDCKKNAGIFETHFVQEITMNNLSPLGYHLYDTYEFIKDSMPYNLSDQDQKDIDHWFAMNNENLPDNEYKGMFAGKNVINIQVESLENFVIGHSYNGQELTPNLNRLLSNSLYFNNIHEQVYNGTSSDCDLMINASIYPVRSGSTFFRFPNNEYNTLAKILRNDKSYASKAIHSDYGYYWNVKNTLSNFGFDKFMDTNDLDHSEMWMMGISDKSFLNQVGDMARVEKNPFYYFTVTTTSHGPFDVADSMRTLQMDETFNKTYMGSYFQAVHYTDEQIGKLVDKLDEAGMLEDTVIAIYGDHTGVHKYYNDSITNLPEKEDWWENDMKIPLIMYNKGTEGKKIETLGGPIDYVPTISYLLGVDKSQYENTSFGRNLLNTNRNFVLMANAELRGGEGLNEEQRDAMANSFRISDMILKSNYFKNKK